MPQSHSLLVEFEDATAPGSASQRFTVLRRMTDLFLADSAAYTDEHIAAFGTFISVLTDGIERQALIELSNRLAPAARAPDSVIGRLARHDDIEIARPVLEQSNILTTHDLVEVAKTKSQAHLSAIAGRASIDEPVTDVLIDRGDTAVAHKTTRNAGARFSRFGLARAVQRAETDEAVAAAVVDRLDLPPELLDHLIRKATTAARERLLAGARPEMKKRITEVLFDISEQVSHSVAPAWHRPEAKSAVSDNTARNRSRILRCVQDRNVEGLLNALAICCEIPVLPVRKIVQQGSEEGLLILGKASGLGWPEMHSVLSVVLPGKTKASEHVHEMSSNFAKLTPANAERAIRLIRANAVLSLARLKQLV